MLQSGDDIYGALVSPSGMVIDIFEICTQPERQFSPDLIRGPEEQVLITWTGWTPTINEQSVNTFRIWGKMYPFNVVGIEEEVVIGKEVFTLDQNYPNPFNPTTTISFELNNENAELIIYNIKGQKIRQFSIFNNQSSVIWDGKDENNKSVSSGVYFYKMKAGKFVSTKKMILLK